MSLITVEVDIDHGTLTPKESHLLPEREVGLAASAAPPSDTSEQSLGEAGEVISVPAWVVTLRAELP